MQQFSSMVGRIYDAALDPRVWPSTLEALSGAFAACFAGFGWEDTRIMAVGGSYANRQIEDDGGTPYRARYKEILIHSNPMRVPVLLTQKVEDVFTPGMLVPVEEYRASRYYREYVQPMGWGDGLSTILSKDDGVVHFLAFARKAGDPPFGDDDIALLKLLSPHLRRAYLIAGLIGRQKAEVTALAETFDGLKASVLMIDAGKRVVYRNESARTMLARKDTLVIRGDRICAAGTNAKFDRALDACLDGKSSDAAPDPVVMDGKEGARHLVHLLPLASRAYGLSRSRDAEISIFVTTVGLQTQSPVQTIAATFVLTPREMNVLVSIVDAGAPAEVAARLGLSVNTVKTHLKAIFAKTGVSKQADLVRLVAGFAGPIREPPPTSCP